VVFARAHAEVRALAGEVSSGCTLTVAALNDSLEMCTIANVGDSYALLVSCDAFRWITEDHRLQTNQTERERVVACGGIIAQAAFKDGRSAALRGLGPLRAWPGGVACARAIGDSDCGHFISAEPVVNTFGYPHDGGGGALVLASDGIWDTLTPAEVAAAVRAASSPQEAARNVVKQVMAQAGLPDDLTCMVAYLGQPAWLEVATITASGAASLSGSFSGSMRRLIPRSPPRAPWSLPTKKAAGAPM